MYSINRTKFFLLATAAVFFHVVFLQRFCIAHAAPDLVFALVVFLGFFAPRKFAIEGAAYAGFLRDLFTTGRFGLTLVIFAGTAYFVSCVAPRFYRDSRLAHGAISAVFYLIASTAWYVFGIWLDPSPVGKDALASFSDFFLVSAVPGAFLVSFVAAFSFDRLATWCGVGSRTYW